MAQAKVAAKDATTAEVRALKARVAELEAEVASLEAELEATEDAFLDEDLTIRKGYICKVYPGSAGWYVGCCPTLHANSQGRTPEEAWSGLDDAIDCVIEAFADWGRPLPPPDVEAKCSG